MIRLAQRFVLEREIGAGGMARVFLGRDEVLDRPVAIKILRFGYDGSDIGARFQREGRTAARLAHPNIVQVYDAGEAEFEGRESSYIVMEYVPGGDLKRFIDERGAVPDAQLAEIGGQVASGLAHAHERGVIHRDIKPHNILLDAHGHSKLTDFGIARALDATQATRTGHFLGTALYSSPEQLQGTSVTPKSDVYSLGATLYEATTGRPPFTGSPISVASQHVSRPPPSPAALNASIGGGLEALILDCLAKDPHERPSADEVGSRLANLDKETGKTREYTAPVMLPNSQEAPTRARSSGAGTTPRRRRRTRPSLAILALLAGLALIAAIGLPTLLAGNEPAGNGFPPKAERPDGLSDGRDQNQDPLTPAPTTRETQPASRAPSETTAETPQSTGGLTREAAVQTIVDHYQVAASDDYRSAWNFLSSGYQRRIGSPEAWTGQFETLESVEFTSGPTAQVEGDTATVSFSTRAVHTNRVDEPSLTATLVNENGVWKIDDLG